jgi:hypothetical protein
MGQERKVYKVLVGNPEGKKPHGRPRHRRKMVSEWILERLAGGVDWIRLSQDRDRWLAVVTEVMNLLVLALRS